MKDREKIIKNSYMSTSELKNWLIRCKIDHNWKLYTCDCIKWNEVIAFKKILDELILPSNPPRMTKQKKTLKELEYKNIKICGFCDTLLKNNNNIDFCWFCWMTFTYYNWRLHPTGKHVNAKWEPILYTN